MPVLLSCERLLIEFSDLYSRSPIERPSSPLPRADCAHQSDILSYIARKIGKLKPGEAFEEDIPERVLLGMMWEEYYFSLIPEVMWQPGEVVEDEIAVNCDGIGPELVVGGVVADCFIEETKCTEKKLPVAVTEKGWEEAAAEKMLEDWMWMHQGRAYCYAYGPRVVRWTVMHYRGDWRGSGPVIVQYVVKFSDAEVAQTWGMLRKNREAAMKEKMEAGR